MKKIDIEKSQAEVELKLQKELEEQKRG